MVSLNLNINNFLCVSVSYLEKQLTRAVNLNPALADDLNDREEAKKPLDDAEGEQNNQIASLIQNSTLIKSYEQLMQQFESDNERKARQIAQLERDQQQLLHENNVMSEQLYQLKSKGLEKDAPASDEGQLDFDHADKVEKDRMVELLKRNHDVMMEKYEVYADRNKTLEKQTLEKEQLYVSIKGENETLQH